MVVSGTATIVLQVGKHQRRTGSFGVQSWLETQQGTEKFRILSARKIGSFWWSGVVN